MGRVADDVKSWSRTATAEEKVKMLRTLAETLGELERSGETLNEKEWDRRFREAQETARTESKSAVHAIETLMRSKTALAAAERRALAASLRPRKGGSGSNSRGESLWQDWIKKNEPGADQNAAAPGTRINPAGALETIKADLASADFLRPDDKARVYLTQRVLDSGIITPEALHKAIGDEMWQAYLDGKSDDTAGSASAAAAADRLEAGTFTMPDLDALKDEALRHADVKEADVPRKERAPSDLETTLKAQMQELSGSDTDAEKPGKWWGMTDAEVGDLVSRPGFQRWAKAHGFNDTGFVNNQGDFVVGGDTAKAIKLAMHQTGRNPRLEFGGEFTGNVFTPAKPEPLFTRGGVTNGQINSVWVHGDDGRIDYLDLDSGTLTPAKDVLGNWKSTALRDTYEKHAKEDPTPHAYGIKGQPAWTVEQFKKHGPIDVVKETAVTSDPKEMLTLPTATTAIKGRLRKPLFGEDPDHDATVEQQDGTLVRLHRERTDAPWTVQEGSGTLYVAPETVEIAKTKVVRPKGEKDAVVAAFRKVRGGEPEKKAEPEITDAEIDAFQFPKRPESMTDEGKAEALTPKGAGTVTVGDEMTPEDRAAIMHKIDAELLGAQLQEGGERMVEGAKRDEAIAKDVAAAKAVAMARPKATIPPPVVAVPEETDVPAVDMSAVKKDEAAFEKRLAERKAAAEPHDLGDENIVVRPAPTETVDGQEVPVRIKPKTDAELRADALRRARAMAAGA